MLRITYYFLLNYPESYKIICNKKYDKWTMLTSLQLIPSWVWHSCSDPQFCWEVFLLHLTPRLLPVALAKCV